MIAKELTQNTVDASAQLKVSEFVTIKKSNDADLKVLFIGNSITKHGVKEEIGWFVDWGMAASCEENDFVHVAVRLLEEKYGKVDYCIAQGATWEQKFTEPFKREDYTKAKEFDADLIVLRIGENIPPELLTAVDPVAKFKELIEYFKGTSCKQVIVTDNFWRWDDLAVYVKQLCENEGYTFCTISDIFEDKSTMALGQFWHEGVALHPNDKGMEMIAKRIVEKVAL